MVWGLNGFPMDTFLPPHEFMLKTLAGEGIVFDEILIDGSMPGMVLPGGNRGSVWSKSI